MSEQEMTTHSLAFDTEVQALIAYRATCISPVSGTEIVRLAVTSDEARRLVKLEIAREAHEAGYTVRQAEGPAEPAGGGKGHA